MGKELYRACRTARDVFDEADEALGTPLSTIIFEGSENELCDTVNSQPAIVAVSFACLKAWHEHIGGNVRLPAIVAGHSLGEYTSLIVSGVLGFGDGVRLARERGRLMHEASVLHPGAMAAIIGLDEGACGRICAETEVAMANINADDQIVLSGETIAIDRATALAQRGGAKKVISLPVSGAFHSPLMKDAQNGLEDAISRIGFHDPQVPIIANCNSAQLTNARQVRAELVHGVCECVQWRDSVRAMVASGVTQVIEFGPGSVLSSLIRRIAPTVERETVNPVSIMKVLEGAG